jgi:hypothetical protein
LDKTVAKHGRRGPSDRKIARKKFVPRIDFAPFVPGLCLSLFWLSLLV